jgi:predicted choloylglycine hydrolase
LSKDIDCREYKFFKYYDASIKLLKEKTNSLNKLIEFNNSGNPSIVSDKSGIIHIVWEQRQVFSDYKSYSSDIYYATVNDTSISQEKFIGKGFYPEN